MAGSGTDPARPGEEPGPVLDRAVATLRGAGARRTELLGKLGIETIGELLTHPPVGYLDRSRISAIRDLIPGAQGTVLARVTSVRIVRPRGGRGNCVADLEDGSGRIRAVWFGQPYQLRRLEVGSTLLLSGPVGSWRGLQLQNPEYESVDLDAGEEGVRLPGLIPVYPLTAGISQKVLRGLIRSALALLPPEPDDPIPPEIRASLGLPDRGVAFRSLHQPATLAEAEDARRRFAFEELLVHQLRLRKQRMERRKPGTGRSLHGDPARLLAVRGLLGYELTPSQEAALEEILEDLRQDSPAARLLQGDVGCGKTAVAALACVWAAGAGAQCCLMAPTEVLALQHHAFFERIFAPAGFRVALLLGSTPGAERKQTLASVAAGEIDLLIGTHALIEEKVVFRDLGFAVVDEQHRFGVMQRARLNQKGAHPHILVMSATPIPRTLALAFYGDLDITTITDLPPGRTPVRTRIVDPARMDDLLRFAAERLRRGSQAFFVYPLVGESDAQDRMDATRAHARIASHPAFAGIEVALLHGRIDPESRDRILARLHAGEIQAVVATTVIEVGIDLPKATLMVIEDPERFGLSQLHQLRGRVGRAPGEEPYCLLVAGPEVGGPARERLEILVREQSGFRIAEEDLRLRGPGEILGTRQAGVARMRIAQPVRDIALLQEARRTADRLLGGDPGLVGESNRLLRKELERLDAGYAGEFGGG